MEDEDGALALGPIDLRFEVGRPVGSPPGEEQRVVMAVSGHVTFSQPGGFAVVVRMENEVVARASFRVTAHPGATPA
jgi:hypothetical protein